MTDSFDPAYAALIEDVAAEIAPKTVRSAAFVVGVSGAQGSGKSTFSARLAAALQNRHGLAAVTLSLDDFYLTRGERQRLAADVHPLCRTRGVPGTHDTALCRDTLLALRSARPGTRTALPVFSKLADDRLPESAWPVVTGRPDIIIFEGWCLGACRRDPASWQGPINALEARCDPAGIWWRWSNAHLERDYQALWALIGLMIFIAVPDFASVVEGRLRQEESLARQDPALADRRMTQGEIVEFTAHYERYTRQLQADMPAACDILIDRDKAFHYRRRR